MAETVDTKVPVAAEHEEAAALGEDTVTISSSDNQTSVTIHRHYCKGCEICVEVCPKEVLRMIVATDRWEGSLVEVVDIEACNACMLCEYQCPDFAIEVYSARKDMKKKEKKAIAAATK